MRPFIDEVIEQLAARHGATTRVDLNDISEIIGLQAVSYEEVEHIIHQLEARGCAVGGPPTVREMMLLREVLQAARALRAALGRKPSVDQIATAIGKPPFLVRRAVENGGGLGS